MCDIRYDAKHFRYAYIFHILEAIITILWFHHKIYYLIYAFGSTSAKSRANSLDADFVPR